MGLLYVDTSGRHWPRPGTGTNLMLENFGAYGYLGVFLALAMAGLGFPMPEELPVIIAGIMCSHEDALRPGDPNRLKWWIMIPVCISGIVLCDGFLYGIGRLWGPRLLATGWVQRHMVSPEQRIRIEKNFRDRGIAVLLGARLLPGIRSPIFMMAGVLRVPFTRFLLADALYAIPGVLLLFWLSYFLTDQILAIFHKIYEYKPLIVVAVLSGIAGALIQRYFLTLTRVSTGEPVEVPKIIAKPAGAVVHAVEAVVEKVANVTHRHHEKPPVEPPDAGMVPVGGSQPSETAPPTSPAPEAAQPVPPA